MNYEYFLAKRIIGNKSYKSSVSAPIIKIGIAAIAISIIVMLIAIATGFGLERKIRDKAVAFNGHISISNFDSNFRLTFDRSMTVTQTNDNYKLYQRTHTNLKVAAGYTILEMKFFRRFPPWFHKIIQTYNLRRLSISKFSTGMEYCGIAKDTGL